MRTVRGDCYGGTARARYTTALAHYDAERRAGRVRSGTPPFGALAFFRNPFDRGNGHVMINRGDGTYLSSGPTVRVVPAAYGGRPLGWSYAPASWPGP